MEKGTGKPLTALQMEEICKVVLESGEIAVWEWDMDKAAFFLSDAWIGVFGSEITEIKTLYELIDVFVIEQDKKSARNDLAFYLNGNSYLYRSEFRIWNDQNDYIWILLTGKMVVHNDGGKMLSGIMRDISQIKKLEDEVKTLAYFDSLTELPNRNLLKCDFSALLDKHRFLDLKGAVIYIDVDNFKQVNDTFGHDYGDILVKVFSQLLIICAADSGKVYHLGGDDFAILMDSYSSESEIEELCSNIVDSCREPFEIKEEQVYISVSIGIATFPDDSSDISELYKFVELAMYYSKKYKKNKYAFFSKDIYTAYMRQVLIEQELKNAIENDEMYLMYQPQVDMEANSIIGFEALLRWNNIRLGFVSPTEFIPIAEKAGSMIKIGDWVVAAVCSKINELKKAECKFGSISLNISPLQFRRPNFIDSLVNTCAENGVAHESLIIEITEGTLLDLQNERVNDLNLLIEKGFRIAIDDFGTGYSSLNYLSKLPVDSLKIDKSFIDNIEDEKNRAVVKCIIELSRMLGYDVIAEGVETIEQLETLMEMGCSKIQGYYFSKPVDDHAVGNVTFGINDMGR